MRNTKHINTSCRLRPSSFFWIRVTLSCSLARVPFVCKRQNHVLVSKKRGMEIARLGMFYQPILITSALRRSETQLYYSLLSSVVMVTPTQVFPNSNGRKHRSVRLLPIAHKLSTIFSQWSVRNDKKFFPTTLSRRMVYHSTVSFGFSLFILKAL